MLNDERNKQGFAGGRRVWPGWVGCIFLAVLAAHGAAKPAPKQVLLLDSYGQAFAPYNTFTEAFRTALAQQLGGGVGFHDVALESAQFEGEAPEGPLVEYLNALFGPRKLDLVVPIGAPAWHFAQKYRARLFPATPMLLAAGDQRLLQPAAVTTNDTVAAVANEPVQTLQGILQVLPATTNIAVVFGNSPLEKQWLAEVRRQFQPFTNRLGFVWFSGLSFAEMQQRVAALPPHSAIFYGLFSVDAAGVPYAEERALAKLHAVANAPIFGLQSSQMGRGIVGGRLMDLEELGRNTARVAARILQGEPAGSIRLPAQLPGRPIYDWRELQRWHISQARLPADSLIRFRQPAAWEVYKWRIIGGLLLSLGEAFLIALLLLNLSKRRRAERFLRESEERFRQVAETIGDFVWEVDASGLYRYASASVKKILGYAPEELVGKMHFYDLFAPDVREELKAAAFRVFAVKEAFRASPNLNVSKEGRIVLLETSGVPVLDEAGGLLGYRGADVDVTQRKAAELALRRNEERLRLVLEANSEGVWDWHIPSGKTFFSPHYCGMLGYEPEEFIKDYDGWKALVHPDDFERVNAAHAAHLQQGKEFWVELRMRKKSGGWCWVRSRGTVVERDAEGRPIRMVGTHMNITPRKEAEEALRGFSRQLIHAQEQERSRLARELHDDVTQRLACLAIDVGRVERKSPDPALGETMLEVREELVQLSDDIHRLAYRLHPSVLEDLGLAEALRAEADRFTGRESVAVEIRLGHLPASIPRDAALCLFRLAQESLRNAARHARPSTVQVSLRALDGGLQLTVKDDGCGFDPELSPERPTLGLAGMRERVRLLGGHLHIHSVPGHGTTIAGWVPMEEKG